MSYSFRIRFRLPNNLRIGIDAEKLLFTPIGTIPEISLCSRNQETPISSSVDLSFQGDGYTSEPEAFSSGNEFRDTLIPVFSRLRIGVDFGNRSPKSFVTELGLKMLQEEKGLQRVLNDIHGLMVFKTDPIPRFVKSNLDYYVTKQKEKFVEALQLSLELHHKLLPEHRLAFDLFSASFFQPSADSRLLMLMMGVETLLKPAPRSVIAQKHVYDLIRITNDSTTLTIQEKDSMIGSLNWLYNESISQAGQKLATRLGSQKYLEMDPPKFFKYCYNLRSSLVHGNIPQPSYEEVGMVTANLETFLGDILAGPLFEQISL